MAEQSQTMDGMHEALHDAGADIAAGGEASARISAETKLIADALAGRESQADDGRPSSRSSTGGSAFSIADTDDLTAMMLMVRLLYIV